MGRKRTVHLDLPMHVYPHHGGYRYLIKTKGTTQIIGLGRDREDAVRRANQMNELKRKERYELVGRIRQVEQHIRETVMQRDNFTCVYCGAVEDLVLDHFIPFGVGGSDSPLNLVTACAPCNNEKHDRNPAWFITQIEGLRRHIIDDILGKYISHNTFISPVTSDDAS